ncbi:hypothetical protein U1Q18_012204 [Sarracenia purpurea var. burkii]
MVRVKAAAMGGARDGIELDCDRASSIAALSFDVAASAATVVMISSLVVVGSRCWFAITRSQCSFADDGCCSTLCKLI